MNNKRSILFEIFKTGSSTLRRRFVLYVVSAAVASILLLLLLLSLFGVINPAEKRIDEYFDGQIENHASQTEHDIDKLAAYSLSFSRQMESVIEDYLAENGLSFDSLTNNIDALTDLQLKSYATVYTNIRVAPCSGAFYILNTTVNNGQKDRYYNGIYIKFANLYSESTVNTRVSLVRGSVSVARNNNISLFSTWHNEMKTTAFDDLSVFDEKDYILSRVEKIPDTWERARYVYSPIYGKDGTVIGVCGFELSDLYLQLVYSAADIESAQTVCALINRQGGKYTGQFISNRSGYVPPKCETIEAEDFGSFRKYVCGNYEYIGKETDVFVGGNLLTVALMIPKKQYESAVRNGRIKNISVLFIIGAFVFGVCLWTSKKYIAPIKKSFEHFKADKSDYTPSGILEIDDLFAFLAEQDRKNEEAFAEIENQNNQLRSSLERANDEQLEAKREIAHLAYSRKTEVDPDAYQQFLLGLKTLTKMERTVFDYYIAGKKVKEIVELLGIKESTVRFHNRNIYSKLGVNSLKQMLLYAAIMNGEQE